MKIILRMNKEVEIKVSKAIFNQIKRKRNEEIKVKFSYGKETVEGELKIKSDRVTVITSKKGSKNGVKSNTVDDLENEEINDTDNENTEERMERSRKRSVNEMENSEEIEESENRKKKRVSEEKYNVKWIIEELDNPTETYGINEEKDELTDVEKLVKQHNKAMAVHSEGLKEWYTLGRKFVQEVEHRKNGGNKKGKKEGEIKREIYTEVIEYMKEHKTQEIGDERKFRGAIRKRFQRGERMYNLFMKIGMEKLERIKKVPVSRMLKLNDEEMTEIREWFKGKNRTNVGTNSVTGQK